MDKLLGYASLSKLDKARLLDEKRRYKENRELLINFRLDTDLQ